MKYLLIDANNLAVRCAFANAELRTSDGTPSGVHYGMFNSLISLNKKFADYQFLMVWDSKSKRRMDESLDGVSKMIIPEAYKANRKKDEQPQPLKDFYLQSNALRRGLGTTGIPQIVIDGYEADDVIAAYCTLLKKDHEIVAVTSDRDYYQILDNNVTLYDGMKPADATPGSPMGKFTTKEQFIQDTGLQPFQHIDVGAMMGDDGDNIFGVPGWGPKTAVKEIQKFGSWQKLIAAYAEQYAGFRQKYSDLLDANADLYSAFAELKAAKSEKDKLIYPEVEASMPWAGVLLAMHRGDIKMPKTSIMALMFQNRIALAYSLKKMDSDIPNLPEIKQEPADLAKLEEYFNYFEIKSLIDNIQIFS